MYLSHMMLLLWMTYLKECDAGGKGLGSLFKKM